MAEIGFEREGNDVRGWTERHGTRFFEVKAKLTGKFNDVGVQQMMTESMESNPDVIVYNFKYFPFNLFDLNQLHCLTSLIDFYLFFLM